MCYGIKKFLVGCRPAGNGNGRVRLHSSQSAFGDADAPRTPVDLFVSGSGPANAGAFPLRGYCGAFADFRGAGTLSGQMGAATGISDERRDV